MTSAGRLVVETLSYDGGRAVSVWMPSTTPTGVVFAADGASAARWGLDLPVEPSVAIVGVHALADQRARLEEYSPVFDAERFAAHESFFVEQVRDWARQRFGLNLPPGRAAVFGASAGGELALALGLRHPDVYGAILAGSPGAGYQPPAELAGQPPRTYLVAGDQEPFFLRNAGRWARALNAAGAEIRFERRDAGHGSALWQKEFPLMLDWAFA
jgi:enterochelin esterase-like enzyme